MNKLYNDTAVQAIANAIRAKNGSSDAYTIAEMSTALNDISYYAKPTISNVQLATFEADGLPFNSLKVSVEAKQAGSGTPSPENVRPISGWDAANVSDVGKNLANWTLTSYTDAPPTELKMGIYTISIRVPLGGNWYISAQKSDRTYCTKEELGLSNFFNSSIPGVYYGAGSSSYLTFTIPEDNVTVKIGSTGGNGQDVMLELGEIISDYEPYNPDSYTTTISLPQTVYGGELDVVNGILKITDGYIASYNGETLPSTWISSMDEYVEGTTPTTGAEVCYELANPIIINLTPSLIKSLDGQNNLSVDCGEIIELEYFKEV